MDQENLRQNEENALTPARKAWVENVSLLLRHKKLILFTSLIVTAGTAVYLFGFAKMWYKADANVVPARKGSGGLLDNLSSGLSSTLKDIGMTQIAGKNKGEGVYSPIALIQSRVLQEQIIKEYDLAKEYDAKNMEDAVKEFSEHASAEPAEEGNVIVSFEDTDPKRAATISNRLVAGLNETNSRLAIEEARFNLAYIQRRWAKLLTDLDSAEKALGEFQKKYGVYELKTQATAQLEVLGTLEQQRYMTEIQLQNAEQLYGENSAETNVLRSQLNEISSKLNDMKTGMDKEASSYFVPMNVLPDVALEYLRLTREFEIQSKLKAFLLPTYEQAKLDETKQSLMFIVLDSAVAPLRKSRPKRSVMLLGALLGSFAISSIAVVALSTLRSARERFSLDKKKLGLS
jgi:uncharacterized protein involved in exopolysaccharide biosynthesis